MGCQNFGCSFYAGIVQEVIQAGGVLPPANRGSHSCVGYGGPSGFSGNQGESKKQVEARYQAQRRREERELRYARNREANRIEGAMAKGCLIVWEES